MKRRTIRYLGAAGALALATSPAGAADQAAELQSLKERVAQLEAQQATNTPNLTFSAGANTTVTIYGYVKADLIYDFDQNLGTTFFGLGGIAPGAPENSNFQGHALQSRLGVRTVTQTSIGEVKTQIEGDFFGSGGGGFRLRHANVTVGRFLFGQYWTNFMPIESYPSTVDFQGPAGITFARVTQFRYTTPVGANSNASFSIEQGTGNTSDPVFTAALGTNVGPAFIKIAALAGRVNAGAAKVDRWGVSLSGNTELWKGATLSATAVTGEGIGSLFVYGGPDVRGGVATEDTGATLGFNQKLNSKWDVGLALGWRDSRNVTAAETAGLRTAHATLTYRPTDRLSVAAELIYGERELGNGSTADASRFQTAVQFNF